ncbi:MAG: hypothetical protein JWM10_1133 [Myxococcaceae bacterium]|nr:hypothetical protein [Myxococcaceae bacterium]
MTGGARVALGDLGLDEGAVVALKHALRGKQPGDTLAVEGSHPALAVHLRAWCRARGDAVSFPAGSDAAAVITVGASHEDRWRDAARAGHADPMIEGAIDAHPPRAWGLAARGAAVEAGSPAFDFALVDRDAAWSDEAPRLYAQAAAAQWDPATAIPWGAEFALDGAVEDAVVQVMTYLVENETAALMVPARFAATIHPHFREVMQLLAIQAADEARHIEVFSRRMRLRRDAPGLSTAGGQASLKTLVDASDFAEASFLLSVLGEGSFLSLLWFLHAEGPDEVTREVARRAAQDEARHVAFGLAHLASHARHDPTLRERLGAAIERRHAGLQHTAGLNDEVHDALVLLAAGSMAPAALRSGTERVQRLVGEMDTGRRLRLRRLGYSDDEARALSALHTRNFM